MGVSKINIDEHGDLIMILRLILKDEGWGLGSSGDSFTRTCKPEQSGDSSKQN